MAKQFLDYEGLQEFFTKLKAYIESALGTATSQALIFKGTVPTSGLDSKTNLPGDPKVGDTYVVSTAGTYASQVCEVGDTVICTAKRDGDPAVTQEYTPATWLVVQKNIDGAVTTTSTLTANTVMLGNGNKTIKPLANGTANQVLTLNSSKVPAWATPTKYVAGTGIASSSVNADTAFSVKTATSSEIGGIKLGYTASGKNYPLVLDSDNKAYVNVPWTDTSYTLPKATASVLGGVKIGTGIAVSDGTISNSGVRSISGSNATLTVNTGGTSSTITINNVTNATTAASAEESVYLAQYSGSGTATATGLLLSKEYSTRSGDTYVTKFSAYGCIGMDSDGNYDMSVAKAAKVANALTITDYDGTSKTTYNGSAAVEMAAITKAEIDALFN